MDVKHAKNLISSLFANGSSVSGKVRLWDGSEISFGKEAPTFVIHFKTPEALNAIWGNLSTGFGEAYTRGDIEVEGDLGEVVSLAYKEGLFSKLSPMQKAHLCWFNLRQKANLKQTKKDVQAHYDRGNFFYKLWLDKGLNYSCAYFISIDDSLEQAQLQKIHHTLKKLRLRPGQRLLDIGCGWGSLVTEAARSYGVRAVGLTLAENQHELGCRRINREGLTGRAEIRLQDYREIPAAERGIYDRIVSIGMFEHVGKENIQVFFEKLAELLRPKGILLLHTIARLKPEPMDPWLKKYIFPNGYIPALGEVVEAAQDVGLDFSDLEDLRLHYDLTLGHWIERFEANATQVRKMMGKQFVRMWRLYLHGSQRSFRHSRLHVFQLLYSMGCRKDWPLARDTMTATSLSEFPSYGDVR